MFLFTRREAPPEGRERPFFLHQTFRFCSREKRKNRKKAIALAIFRLPSEECASSSSSALAEHTRGRPPQIQNKPRPPGRRADEAEEAHAPRNATRGVMADVGPQPPDKKVHKNALLFSKR